jgi:hypothetical protein
MENLSETQVTTPTTPAGCSTPYYNGVSLTYFELLPLKRGLVVNDSQE